MTQLPTGPKLILDNFNDRKHPNMELILPQDLAEWLETNGFEIKNQQGPWLLPEGEITTMRWYSPRYAVFALEYVRGIEYVNSRPVVTLWAKLSSTSSPINVHRPLDKQLDSHYITH